MKNNGGKRVLSLLLSICMLFSLITVSNYSLNENTLDVSAYAGCAGNATSAPISNPGGGNNNRTSMGVCIYLLPKGDIEANNISFTNADQTKMLPLNYKQVGDNKGNISYSWNGRNFQANVGYNGSVSDARHNYRGAGIFLIESIPDILPASWADSNEGKLSSGIYSVSNNWYSPKVTTISDSDWKSIGVSTSTLSGLKDLCNGSESRGKSASKLVAMFNDAYEDEADFTAKKDNIISFFKKHGCISGAGSDTKDAWEDDMTGTSSLCICVEVFAITWNYGFNGTDSTGTFNLVYADRLQDFLRYNHSGELRQDGTSANPASNGKRLMAKDGTLYFTTDLPYTKVTSSNGDDTFLGGTLQKFQQIGLQQTKWAGGAKIDGSDCLGFCLWGELTGGTKPVVTSTIKTNKAQVGVAKQTIDAHNNYPGDYAKSSYYKSDAKLEELDKDVLVKDFSTTASKHTYTGVATTRVSILHKAGDIVVTDKQIKEILDNAYSNFTSDYSYAWYKTAVATDGKADGIAGYTYKPNINHFTENYRAYVKHMLYKDLGSDSNYIFAGLEDMISNVNSKDYTYNAIGNENEKSAYSLTRSNSADSNWIYNPDDSTYTLKAGKTGAVNVGVGYEISLPKTKSYFYEYTVNLDDESVTTSSDTKEYYTDNFDSFKTSKSSRYLVAIPRGKDDANKVTGIEAQLKSWLKDNKLSEISSCFTQGSSSYLFKGKPVEVCKNIDGHYIINVGANTDGTYSANGYYIYVLALKGNPKLETGFALPAQDLNHVYQGVVAQAAYPDAIEGTQYSPLLSSSSNVSKQYNYNLKTVVCTATHSDNDGNEYKCSGYGQYFTYKIEKHYKVFDEGTGGTNSVIALDDASVSQRLLLRNNLMAGGVVMHTRQELKNKVKVTDDSTHRYDYAYNLNRYVSKDKRTLSALTLSTVAQQEWAKNVGAKFGVLPNTDAPTVSPKRNDSALITDKYTSKLVFNSSNVWDNHNYYNIIPDVHVHDNGNSGSAKYHKQDINTEEFKPYTYMGYPCYKVTINITDSFYKYSTDKINSDKPGTNGESRQVNDLAVRASELGAANYRMAYIQNFTDSEDRTTVKNNDAGGILLTYYPEVAMRQYLYTSGVKDADSDGKVDTINASSDIAPTIINTIGEYKRKTYSNSLYVFRLRDTDSNNENNVTGKIFSDDMSTGTQTDKSNNLPTIYSGSNITINADCVFTADAYGYALDMVSYEDDKDGFVTQIKTDALAEVKLPYSSVIQGKESNGTPINPMKYYQPDNLLANGKSKSKANLYKDYKNWVSELTNAGYWGADMTLKINRSSNEEVFNNFSTSVGSIKFTPANQKENGAYPIVIKHGVVVKDGDDAAGYKALIKQISADFTCTEDQAAQLFEKSGMYKAIVNAIESDTNDENKSIPDIIYTNSKSGATQFKDALGTAYSYENGNLLGNKDHWYDESVRVFCIRRYETTGIKISGIMCNDKIDYSSAAQQNTQDTVNNSQAKYNNVRGKWYLTLYFKKGQGASATKSVRGIDPANEYDPKVYTGLGTARGNGDVVLSESYVQQCDFLIPNASTSDTDD